MFQVCSILFPVCLKMIELQQWIKSEKRDKLISFPLNSSLPYSLNVNETPFYRNPWMFERRIVRIFSNPLFLLMLHLHIQFHDSSANWWTTISGTILLQNPIEL